MAMIALKYKNLVASSFLLFNLVALSAHAAPSHCIALYGECKYKASATHFEYVNPQAPKGGQIKLGEMGTFDSLNPYVLKGVKAPGLTYLYESLMTPSFDEPETVYGLIAESADIAPDRLSMTFTIRKAARWHDGTPITPEDVVFSLNALKEKADPTYQLFYQPIEKAEKTGERQVKFTFKDANNRELPFIAAQMPVLPKAYYDQHKFEDATLEPPLSSGPYRIGSVDPGRSMTYERVKDYWAADLPVNKGQYNFDHIIFDMYRDENVSLEAFKGGAYDFRQEYIARNWATAYDTPAVNDGRIIKKLVEHSIPQGMQAFIYNTRKPELADRRVREAIDLTLDFDWLNRTIFYGAYKRNTSFFQSTPFMATGLPKGKELALLEPFRANLPPELFSQEFKIPPTDGSGNARENLLKAQRLLEDAGWIVKDGKRVNATTGKPFQIEFLLRQPTMQRVIGPMRKNLERLGIASSIRMVDDAQYQKRTDNFDFDVVSIWINRGVFFPGNEQRLLWHSSQAEVKGSNHLSGLQSPAIDAVLAQLVNAKDLESLTAAGKALDRILLWEHVVIPNWHANNFRIAWWNKFDQPAVTPKYNLGLTTWWAKESKP